MTAVMKDVFTFNHMEQLQDYAKGLPQTESAQGDLPLNSWPYFYNCWLQISPADRRHAGVDGIPTKAGNPSVLLLPQPGHRYSHLGAVQSQTETGRQLPGEST